MCMWAAATATPRSTCMWAAAAATAVRSSRLQCFQVAVHALI
jgi:hypothetical protein